MISIFCFSVKVCGLGIRFKKTSAFILPPFAAFRIRQLSLRTDRSSTPMLCSPLVFEFIPTCPQKILESKVERLLVRQQIDGSSKDSLYPFRSGTGQI